ncbi:hypothetical protein MUN81_15520 [Hymenobacter sp. 5317J-9]|uniref:hypothetical protein n=1 Tax=Hymenobacter sp. 5317J-9 TaxID=2932250 RepID=UPI001FD720A4|nr:hypothetical protein [Hymenobacter sp. 5317J-9]UOQ96645.1 hypothetical protein MUN81_15520 [Hymenobacter sp. 5317J-9]
MPESMTRAQHLQWAKTRALEYLDAGNLTDAWASFVSDLGKHPETAGNSTIELGMLEMMMGGLNTAAKLRHHIEGTH